MILLILLTILSLTFASPEESEGVKYANKCEVCKILAIELESRLEETGQTSEVLKIGYSIDKEGPKIKYKKSELRLIEAIDGVCNQILEYNIHKERTDSTRFAKGMSQTFKTLHGLVNKGVKVELGIPLELWDKPSVEITDMKTQCEYVLENYEEDISRWYFKHQGNISLKTYLCEKRFLKGKDTSCLSEALPEERNSKGEKESIKKKDEL